MCSEYFESLFTTVDTNNPVIVFKDLDSTLFESVLDYMYIGEVNIEESKLSALMKTAEFLKIKGLAQGLDTPPCVYEESDESRVQEREDYQEFSDSKRRKQVRLNIFSKNIIPNYCLPKFGKIFY